MHDVVVIGAGPAGIAAAVTAAAHGKSVIVIDESPRPGGQIWRHLSRNSLPRTARHWIHRLERCGARVMSGTSVVDVVRSDGGFAITCTRTDGSARDRMPRIDAASIIIATGARERFLPFPGWTTPGVVGVGGAQALLKAGAPMHGKRIIVAGSGPLLLPVAAALAHAGADVTHVLEQAATSAVANFAIGLWRTPSRAVQAGVYRARSLGARYRTASWVSAAEGGTRVRAATIVSGAKISSQPCDLLCVGYGLVPSLEIALLIGCKVRDGAVVVDANQCTSIANVYAVGESTRVAGVDAALAEGEVAGHAAHTASQPHAAVAPTAAGATRALLRRIRRERAFAERMDVAFKLRPELRQLATPETIVCRCEDVTLAAIAKCESMREAKLHTRAGMGPCQGRVCGPAMQTLFNWTESSVRPPVVPAMISTFLTDDPAVAGGAK